MEKGIRLQPVHLLIESNFGLSWRNGFREEPFSWIKTNHIKMDR